MILDITHLPREIQFCIFSKLDGRSLRKIKTVCQKWEEIVTHLETQCNVWRTCCMTEIPDNIFQQLSGVSFLIEDGLTLKEIARHVEWEFWRELYQEYCRCEVLCDWEQTLTEISIPYTYGKATSVALGDGFLISGHVTGDVVMWENLFESENRTFKVLHKHYQHVTKVTVMSPGRRLRDLPSTACVRNITPLVISSSRDRSITVSPINGSPSKTINHFSKQVNNLSVSSDCIVAAAQSSIIHGQPVWTVTSFRPLKLRQTAFLGGHPTSDVTAVAMNDEVVVSGDSVGNLMLWNMLETKNNGENFNPLLMYMFTSPVRQICIQSPRLICLLDDGSVCIQQDFDVFQTWTGNKLFPVLKGIPKCLVLWSTLLALATTNGGVYLYAVPDNTSWSNINLMKPTCTIKTGKKYITSIDINDDGISPVVVMAADDETILIQRWKPSVQH